VVAPFAHLHAKVLRQPVEFALAALVAVEYRAGHRAAADSHRHGQRAVSQLCVVMGAEREPDDPARAHVQHRIEVELALGCLDLSAVAVPAAVDPVRAELALALVR
jgi:hypothetical protein